MAVRYRCLGQVNRAWTVDTWADWSVTLPTAKLQDGDTLYYVEGNVALTRRGGRWRPNEPKFWGYNDATSVPFGTIDSEGVWTIAPNAAVHEAIAPINKFLDVLAVVMSTGAERIGYNVASRTNYGTDALAEVLEAPCLLGLRGVYFEKAGTGTVYVGKNTSVAEQGIQTFGCAGAPPTDGSTGDGVHARCIFPGMIARGGDGGSASGADPGLCLNNPGSIFGEETASYNIVAWGELHQGTGIIASS